MSISPAFFAYPILSLKTDEFLDRAIYVNMFVYYDGKSAY